MKEEALQCNLAVHGTKIAIYDQQDFNGKSRIVRYNPNHFRLGEERPKTAQGDRENCENPNHTYREVFKLKTGRISGSGVATRQLREIRDSVEIDDFKRLLGSLEKNVQSCEGDVPDLSLVRCIDVGKIYRDFYAVHYEFLSDLCGEK
ncbi:hypothetical protein Trydic_g20420 [Trypoxylus dichotomus]